MGFRMSVSVKTQKMLWGRAAARCSKPDCRIDLYEDETATDDPTLVGQNCHIIAESDDGPRSNSALPMEKRNSYGNLILLCSNHHTVVDAQEGEYTVERLSKMKMDHEKWVKEKLGVDLDKQSADENYASIIDKWEQLSHLDNWLGWSSCVLGHGQPRMLAIMDNDLFELRGWLLSRVWPGRYTELENAFHNFRRILQDFQECFREHAVTVGTEGILLTQKFYKNAWGDEEE